jgi:hypothetical protein
MGRNEIVFEGKKERFLYRLWWEGR